MGDGDIFCDYQDIIKKNKYGEEKMLKLRPFKNCDAKKIVSWARMKKVLDNGALIGLKIFQFRKMILSKNMWKIMGIVQKNTIFSQ